MNNLLEISFAGPLHNQILQNITQLGNFPNFTTFETYNVAKMNIENFYNENHLGDAKILSFEEFDTQLKRVLSQSDDMTSLFTELKNEGLINTIQLDFLLMINDLFINATDPNKLGDNLFQLESQINNSPDLSFNEKALIFGTCVIGRNSAYYWSVAFSNPSNPWNIQNYNSPQAGPSWWARGLRDLAGFTVGFIIGSVISFGNPAVGTSCGICVGAGCSAG